MRLRRPCHASSRRSWLGRAAHPGPCRSPGSPIANWIGFTIGGAFVNGDDAGFMRRAQTNGDFYGGIESLMFSKDSMTPPR